MHIVTGDDTRRPQQGPARSDAFRALLEPHYEGAFRFACYLAGDSARGADVLHDALVRALRGFPHLEDPRRFRSWLLQIIANVARNDGRGHRLRSAVLAFLSAGLPRAAFPQPRADERQIIGRCLRGLPAEQREALILFDFEGESVADIARLQGVGEPTVRSRILYARRKFRRLYADHGGDREQAGTAVPPKARAAAGGQAP